MRMMGPLSSSWALGSGLLETCPVPPGELWVGRSRGTSFSESSTEESVLSRNAVNRCRIEPQDSQLGKSSQSREKTQDQLHLYLPSSPPPPHLTILLTPKESPQNMVYVLPSVLLSSSLTLFATVEGRTQEMGTLVCVCVCGGRHCCKAPQRIWFR